MWLAIGTAGSLMVLGSLLCRIGKGAHLKAMVHDEAVGAMLCYCAGLGCWALALLTGLGYGLFALARSM